MLYGAWVRQYVSTQSPECVLPGLGKEIEVVQSLEKRAMRHVQTSFASRLVEERVHSRWDCNEGNSMVWMHLRVSIFSWFKVAVSPVP